MATKKTTTKTEEIVETTEPVVETKKEVIVEKEPVAELKPEKKVIAHNDGVSIYSIPSLQSKRKIGTMTKGTAYVVLEENVTSSVYGDFYHIAE